MERAGIRKIYELEGIASDQPQDRGESNYKRDKGYDGEREGKDGTHDVELYLPIFHRR